MLRFVTLLLVLSVLSSVDFTLAAFPEVNCSAPVGWGASNPPAVCSDENPCTALLSTYSGKIDAITIPQFIDFPCKGWIQDPFAGGGWKNFDDGDLQTVSVPSASEPAARTRRFCQFIPAAASQSSKVPLLISVHGSGGNATNMYGATNWRVWGNAKEFAVVGTQAMNRHWPASGVIGAGEDGTKNDYLHRHPLDNDDVKYFDALIDSLVATGKIDAERIYLSGWSNGAYFSNWYAMLRSGASSGGIFGDGGVVDGATPGGNRVAAVASFSGADPLLAVAWNTQCKSDPPPVSSAFRVMIVSRLCDIVHCDTVQAFISKATNSIQSENATHLLVSASGAVLPAGDCETQRAAECNYAKDVAGHMVWPKEQQQDMYDFLMRYTAPQITTTVAATTTTGATTSAAAQTTTAAPTTSEQQQATTSDSASSASPTTTAESSIISSTTIATTTQSPTTTTLAATTAVTTTEATPVPSTSSAAPPTTTQPPPVVTTTAAPPTPSPSTPSPPTQSPPTPAPPTSTAAPPSPPTTTATTQQQDETTTASSSPFASPPGENSTTAAASDNAGDAADDTSGHSSPGERVGIIIGMSILAFILLVGGLWFLRKKIRECDDKGDSKLEATTTQFAMGTDNEGDAELLQEMLMQGAASDAGAPFAL